MPGGSLDFLIPAGIDACHSLKENRRNASCKNSDSASPACRW